MQVRQDADLPHHLRHLPGALMMLTVFMQSENFASDWLPAAASRPVCLLNVTSSYMCFEQGTCYQGDCALGTVKSVRCHA